ncbi:MAG: hypothetical protein ABF293_11115 [Flavobacteriaceae bacterium]
MAPIKFEKKIKELFEAREIRPSEDAWQKVASQLESSPAKRNLRPWHYWVAASIAFIIFVVGWSVKKSGQPEVDNTPMVEQSNKPKPLKPQSALPVLNNQTEVSSVTDEAGKTDFQINETVVSPNPESGLAEVQENKPSFESQPEDVGEVLLDEKISELLVQIGQMEASENEVTEAEVDSLLRAAQRALLADQEFKEEARSKGASLLAEVEGELDESFRDQVFEKLKQGFIRVRTAVADRNK